MGDKSAGDSSNPDHTGPTMIEHRRTCLNCGLRTVERIYPVRNTIDLEYTNGPCIQCDNDDVGMFDTTIDTFPIDG